MNHHDQPRPDIPPQIAALLAIHLAARRLNRAADFAEAQVARVRAARIHAAHLHLTDRARMWLVFTACAVAGALLSADVGVWPITAAAALATAGLIREYRRDRRSARTIAAGCPVCPLPCDTPTTTK